MPKKRRTASEENQQLTPFVGSGSAEGGPQPQEHQPINLSHLANVPVNLWPENKEKNFGLTLTKDEKKILGSLKKRKIQSSRYICIPTLQKLGILDEVRTLAERIGIWNLISEPLPTFRTLTYEFLATFRHDAFDWYSFQLDGTRFTVTADQFNTMLGLSSREYGEELDWEAPWHEGNQTAFEEQLIGGSRGNSYRTSLISHPVTRILQRVMAFTIFGRGETASVFNRSDTFFLYKMLYGGQLPDIGAFVARHIDHIVASTYAGGSISIGGLVTRIAHQLNVIGPEPVYRVKAEETIPLLNLKYLKSAELIRLDGEAIYHLTAKKEMIPFPLQPFIIEDPNSWIARSMAAPPSPDHIPPPPPSATDPAAPGMQQMMDYMLMMHADLTAQNNNLSAQYTGLSAQYTGLSAQYADLQNSYAQSQAELHDVQGQNMRLSNQMARMESSHHTRFDDLYCYAEQTEQLAYDTDQLTRRMYQWNIESQGMPEQLLERRRRPRLRHPFNFPTNDNEDEGGDAP